MLLVLYLLLLPLALLVPLTSCSKKKETKEVKSCQRSQTSLSVGRGEKTPRMKDSPPKKPRKEEPLGRSGKTAEQPAVEKTQRSVTSKCAAGPHIIEDVLNSNEEDTKDDVDSLEPADLNVKSEDNIAAGRKVHKSLRKVKGAGEQSTLIKEDPTAKSERSIREARPPRKIASKEGGGGEGKRAMKRSSGHDLPTAKEKKHSGELQEQTTQTHQTAE